MFVISKSQIEMCPEKWRNQERAQISGQEEVVHVVQGIILQEG